MTTSAGTDHAAFLDGLELHDELSLTIDPKTLEILDRRRRTSVVKRRGWLIRRMLLAADLIGLLAAMAVAELLTPTGADEPLSQGAEFAIFALSLPLWVVAAKVYGLYERDEERTDHSGVDEFTGVFHMITVCTWLFWAVTYVFNIGQSTLPKLLVFWAAAVVFVVTGRAIARAICRRRINYLQNTIIVGAGEVGQLIAKKVLHHPEYGINLGSPSISRRNFTASCFVAIAISSTKLCTENAWKLWIGARHQPRGIPDGTLKNVLSRLATRPAGKSSGSRQPSKMRRWRPFSRYGRGVAAQ